MRETSRFRKKTAKFYKFKLTFTINYIISKTYFDFNQTLLVIYLYYSLKFGLFNFSLFALCTKIFELFQLSTWISNDLKVFIG